MEVKDYRLADLKPYENNPRKNDDAVDAVANSIKTFGFKVPLVIDEDGIIVCGHTRYKAAQKLKLECVPCVVANDLSPELIKAFRCADNKVSELAEWDNASLLDELNDLALFDIDMADFGFDVSSVGLRRKSWAKTEKLCDLKKKIKVRSMGDIVVTSIYEVGKRGIPISEIKEKESNAELFSDNLCDYVELFMGGNNIIKGDWCLCTTPQRRHKDGFHFATAICRATAKKLGLPFYEDAFTAENRDRIEPDFNMVKNPKETNVILYDDIVTTGQTIRAVRKLLLDEGHVVICVVGITNKTV